MRYFYGTHTNNQEGTKKTPTIKISTNHKSKNEEGNKQAESKQKEKEHNKLRIDAIVVTNTEVATPKSKNRQPISYEEATSGNQTNLINHEKKRGKHNRRFEVSFTIEDPKQQKPECKLSNLQNMLTAILKRAKKVDTNQ